jgi:hypothetical protein
MKSHDKSHHFTDYFVIYQKKDVGAIFDGLLFGSPYHE